MFESKRSGFEALVRAYSAELYRYAYWLSRDRFAAEDLLQDTFARAWKGWTSIRDRAAAKSWLYTILRNEHARSFERKRLDLADDADMDALADVRLSAVFEDFDMQDAIRALPETYREPLLLQVIGGFNCDEIAKLMNLRRGAVMTRLSRARLALRKQSHRAVPKKVST